MERLSAHGIPVPRPAIIDAGEGGGTWLVTPWVDAATGATWLTDPARSRRLAERMGRLAERLGSVDTTGLDLDARAATNRLLATHARERMRGLALDPPIRRALQLAIEPLAVDADRRSGFVHGDFAPINVLIDEAGEIVALLDLEHARIGPPGVDLAWWGWVVRHHHPDAWAAAWRTLCVAAGADPDTDGARGRGQMLAWLIVRAGAALDPVGRSRWLERLAEAVAW
jgi:aminoglycoside phosphotransferase (APT) family kinase protein